MTSIKNVRFVLLCGVVCALFATGCATPRAIPSSYYQQRHEMSVKVIRCPDKPQMMDSDQGGLIGMVVRGARGSTMREQMMGLQGSTLSELIRQSIETRLEDHFDVVDDKASMTTEINVVQWGWFVPSTVLGIKTGSYQFRINGKVTVYDLSSGKRRVANVGAVADHPLGSDPTSANMQEAMQSAADDFAEKSMAVILRDRSR